MKTRFSTCLLLVLLVSSKGSTQIHESPESNWEEPPVEFTRQFQERTFRPIVPEHFSRDSSDWSEAIDSIWGVGLPTAQKLAIFDNFWTTIDHKFACFQDIEVDWDSLRNLYRPEIEQGVSRGRFAAIMSKMSVSLRESHTNVSDNAVHNNTSLLPGVPLMVVGGWGYDNHFGAGLTPQPDGSLLVYKTLTNHPLGLKRGDKVLGYDGMAWQDCYKELLDADLPLTGWWWGSSPSSFEHSFLMSAGSNWHLFDTIDIVKYDTGDTLHLATSALNVPISSQFLTEQMDIPGVPKPNYNAQKLFSYGIVQGTNIGYIYGWGWFWNAEDEFLDAVTSLVVDHNTNGLIIDFRMNYGGNMFLSDTALAHLFYSTVETVDFVYRCDTADHFGLCPENFGDEYTIHPALINGYSKPIALLVGPGAISSGDQVALRIKFHPNSRVFGKSTSTAFNSPSDINLGNSNWSARFAEYDAYLLSAPGDYLTHNEFEVDEEVWLTPEDVAEGDDTVVEAAIAWINSVNPTASKLTPQSQLLEISPNPAANFLNIHLSEPTPTPLDVQVFDAQGRLLRNERLPDGQALDVQGLVPGMYSLRVVVGELLFAGKFVKQ